MKAINRYYSFIILIGEMEVHNPHSSDLRCPTCAQNFPSTEAHKEHYRSEFHRYNLKRKMVKLSPITEEQFKEKRVETQQQENSSFTCNQCGYDNLNIGKSIIQPKH